MANNVREPKSRANQQVPKLPKSKYLAIVLGVAFGWIGSEFVGSHWGFLGIAVFLAGMWGLLLLAVMIFNVRSLRSARAEPTQLHNVKR